MGWQERDYAGTGDGRGGGGFGLLGGGGRGGRFSDNPLNWSPSIGSLFGIRIRIHLLFILFILFRLISSSGGFLWTAQWLTVLFGSVFLHELGHCFAARYVGGRADQILMWPLGGLASVDAPRLPWPQFVTVVCGPLVNLVLVVFAYFTMTWGAPADLVSWNPFGFGVPVLGGHSSIYLWLFVIHQINLILLLFNLWPMYPMDGGRMLQCALWKKLGYQRSMLITTTIGMVAAILMGLYGLANKEYLLLVIALFGYITCYQERQLVKAGVREQDGFMSYDFSGGYSTLPEAASPRKGWFARWREKAKRGAWEAKRKEQELLELRVDAILEKVKREGINSLSRREKKLLEQATQKQQATDRKHGL